mmetsp:Transcript_22637/g.31605  ORF Transcript_22637/g.31605 Transcript_22637/m.31605 type:complete len:81 (+) Transcript_22637:617-859(+)
MILLSLSLLLLLYYNCRLPQSWKDGNEREGDMNIGHQETAAEDLKERMTHFTLYCDSSLALLELCEMMVRSPWLVRVLLL